MNINDRKHKPVSLYGWITSIARLSVCAAGLQALPVCLSVCLSVRQDHKHCPSVCLSVCLSGRQQHYKLCPSVCLCVCLDGSITSIARLSVCVSVWTAALQALPVCLSVCLSGWQHYKHCPSVCLCGRITRSCRRRCLNCHWMSTQRLSWFGCACDMSTPVMMRMMLTAMLMVPLTTTPIMKWLVALCLIVSMPAISSTPRPMIFDAKATIFFVVEDPIPAKNT